MKLSVIVPVYNVAGELPGCVESLLRQEGCDFEILLIDDGSTDGQSGSLCDRFAAGNPERIRAIHRPNGGPGAARNTGIDAAEGEYILFVDGDDHVSDKLVRTLLPYMEQGVDVVGFDFYVEDHGKLSVPGEELLPYGRTVSLAEYPEMLLSSPCVWNKLWRRALFTDQGIRFPEGIWYEDLAATVKLFTAAASVTAVKEKLYYYVVREGSITRNTEITRNREIMSAMDDLMGWYRRKGLDSAFHNELEAVCVRHVLLTASVRVLRAGYDPGLLDGLTYYLRRRFPAWERNPYVERFPARHRWILRALSKRRYRLVKTLFRIKDSIASAQGRSEG